MTQWIWGGAQEFVFLTNAQVMLLLTGGLHFESHWPRLLKLQNSVLSALKSHPLGMSKNGFSVQMGRWGKGENEIWKTKKKSVFQKYQKTPPLNNNNVIPL